MYKNSGNGPLANFYIETPVLISSWENLQYSNLYLFRHCSLHKVFHSLRDIFSERYYKSCKEIYKYPCPVPFYWSVTLHKNTPISRVEQTAYWGETSTRPCTGNFNPWQWSLFTVGNEAASWDLLLQIYRCCVHSINCMT